MIISIHQPNFMPWFPFFQKIMASDRFIILSNCQFEKNNYQNRFNIGEKWNTMSVNSGIMNIIDKQYVNYDNDWRKIKTNLKDYSEELSLFDECISNDLNHTNISIIKKICELLEIKTEILYDYTTELKGTERLIDLVKHYEGDTYLSGISGGNYLDIKQFEENGIKLINQASDDMIRKPIIEILKKQYR